MRDLYYNTRPGASSSNPATEFAHCAEAVKRIALAHPAVAFTLSHNGRVTLHLAKNDSAGRAGTILGEDSLAESRSLDTGTAPLRLSATARHRPIHVRAATPSTATSTAALCATSCSPNGAARSLPGYAAR